MSDFAAKFTNANIAQDAAPYDSSLFQALNEKISKIEPSTHKGFSIALLVQSFHYQFRFLGSF